MMRGPRGKVCQIAPVARSPAFSAVHLAVRTQTVSNGPRIAVLGRLLRQLLTSWHHGTVIKF